MKRIHSGKYVVRITLVLAFLALQITATGQTKYYITAGMSDVYYHNSSYSGIPSLRNFYYGIEVDKYLGYHYALTFGACYLEGGYDDNVDKMVNNFIQVPIGIKAASLGDQFGVTMGFNINILLNSKLTEPCDPIGNDVTYYTLDVTSAMQKIQPDFYFGLLFRLNRITAQMKFAYALTNRYSTEVKILTDQDPCYYGSFYAYELGKNEQSLTAWTTLLTVSIRVF